MSTILQRLYATIYLLLLYAPIVLLIVFSFNDSVYIAFPLKGITTRWYEDLAHAQGLWDALLNSLFIAVMSSVLSTVIAVLAAMAFVRTAMPARTQLQGLIYAPLALPAVLFGVSLLSMFMMSGIGLHIGTVVFGHLIVCTPFAYAVLHARLAGLNPDYERASSDLGEGPVWTFFRVTFPLLRPGLASSLLLTFTVSFDEFVLSFFLSSNSPTLPVYLYSQMRFPDRLPMVLAVASIIVAVSLVMILLSEAIRRRN